MVKVVSRSAAIAAVLAAGIIHTSLAAPITSNWTPGNVGNWSGGAAADAANWAHSQPPTPPSTQTFPRNNVNDTYSVIIGGGSGSVVSLNTNVTIDSLQIDSADTLDIDNVRTLSIVSGGAVTNNGALNINSTGSITGLNFLGTSTISGGGTITLGNGVNNRITQSSATGVITNAAGHKIRGAGSILTNQGGFDNAGTIIADQATALIIDPGAVAFNNTGTLRAETGAELRMLGGTYNNGGGTIEADGAGSHVNLATSLTIINGGTLATTNGGEIRSGSNTGAILDGVTIAAGSRVVQGNIADLRVQNGVTNNGTWELNSTGSQTAIQFLGSQTIGGTGEIVMGNNAQNAILAGTNLDVLTLASTQTIRGAGRVLLNAGGFINDGAVRQQGSVEMVIDPGSTDLGGGVNFINNGTLRSEGSGGISLFGAIYQNTGQSIETTGGGDVSFASNAIELLSGNLTSSGGGVFRSTAGTGAIFNNVTLTTGSDFVQVNGEDVRIRNGVTNNGTWSLNSTGSTTDMQFLGSQTIGGTGEIVMSDNVQNRIFTSTNADQITLAGTQTIRGAGQLLTNAGGFVNNGTILQQGSAALVIDPGSLALDGNGSNFINNGVLRTEGTGGLTLNAAIYRNDTVIETTGGGDIRLASNAVVLRGGDLTTSGGGVVRSTAGTGAILENVRLTSGSDIVQVNGEDIRIRNGITNDGTWSLNSTGSTTDILFLGSQTIGGSGEIVMSDNIRNRIFASTNADVLTVGAAQTIRGAGEILLNSGGAINNGTIIADGALNSIVIDAGANFSNQGTLRASGTQGFDIRGGTDFTQAGGLVDIQSGSRIDITFGDYVQTGGETRVTGTLATTTIGSSIQLQGGLVLATGLVDFNGLGVHVLNNTGGTLAAGASPGILTVQNGNYVQGAGGTFEFELDGFVAGVGHDLLSIVNGDADLDGDLNVIADLGFASTLNIGDEFEVVRITGGDFDADNDMINEMFDTISVNLAGLEFSQFFRDNSLWIEVTLANVGAPEVPEPHMLVLMMLGLTVIVWMRRRRADVTIH
ncbi:MAG: beta strand repeat-containing protein [Alphaproteobacteria bacterium]